MFYFFLFNAQTSKSCSSQLPLLKRSGVPSIGKGGGGALIPQRLHPIAFSVVFRSSKLTKNASGFRHSYLSASTGFLVAALQLCQLTVSSAIPNANKPAKAKIHQLSSVL
jgi:hypothetical protein